MISLASLIFGYVLAVFLGSRNRRMSGRLVTILLISGVIQVALVLIKLFLMEPPLIKPFGQ